MKIDPNLTIGGMNPQGVNKPSGKPGAFEKVLSGIEQPAAPEMLAIQTPPNVTMISPTKLKGLGLGEQAIELLGGYAEKLADPSVTLKTLQPMVDELAGLKEGLDKTMATLSDNDPLKGILKDVGSTIESEVLRFHRGDLLM